MFQTGDRVAHPGHGGCIVMDTCTQKIGSDLIEYLIIVPQDEEEMQIMVPIGKLDQIGVRELVSPETADRILDSFSETGQELQWDHSFAKRKQMFLEILKRGSLESLAEMIRIFLQHPQLGSGEKAILPQAQKKLYSELALAKGFEFRHVFDMVESKVKSASEKAE